MENYIFSSGSRKIISVHGAGYADTSTPRHHVRDSDFIFEYVISGEERVESPEYLVTAGIGSLIVINPSEECVIYKSGKDASALYFRITGFVLEASAEVLALPKIFCGHSNALDRMFEAAELYKRYSAGDGAAGRALCEIAFSLLLEAVAIYSEDNIEKPVRPNAEAIKEYLEICLCGDIDLSDVGKKFGITGMHVIRLFRTKYGMTPMQYLKIKRLEKSAELLADSTMSIKEISSLLRFSNTQHFTNLFRDRFGITPGKFREDANSSSDSLKR